MLNNFIQSPVAIFKLTVSGLSCWDLDFVDLLKYFVYLLHNKLALV